MEIPSVHYTAWHLLQHEAWSFPIGTIDTILAPFGTSITMTDSIPLFAIPFKLINSIFGLSYHFQYFGIYSVFCNTLQIYFVILILKRYIASNKMARLVSLFFLLRSVMIWRMLAHPNENYVSVAYKDNIMEKTGADANIDSKNADSIPAEFEMYSTHGEKDWYNAKIFINGINYQEEWLQYGLTLINYNINTHKLIERVLINQSATQALYYKPIKR